MAKGWIKLSRELQDHWIWNAPEAYDIRSAWVDLLLLANHEDKKGIYNGKVVTYKRGTIFRSVLSLSKRWHWDRKKVKRFLDLLESDGMVTTKGTTEGTTITIVNYGKIQDSGTTKRATNGTTSGQHRDTNKNDKEINKNNIRAFNTFQKASYDMEEIEKALTEVSK